MRLLLIGIGVLLVVGCSSGAPAVVRGPSKAAPPPSPAAQVSDGCAREMRWIDDTMWLRFDEHANVQTGWYELHASFFRFDQDAVFYGVVTGTYRAQPSEAPRVESRTIQIAAADVIAFLETMRDLVQTPAEPEPRGRLVAGSNEIVHVKIEAIAHEPVDGEEGAIFYTRAGGMSPAPWELRGCRADPPHEARHAIGKAVAAFAQRLDRDGLLRRIGVWP